MPAACSVGRSPSHLVQETLSTLDLDASLLARCYESEEVTGKLTPQAAESWASRPTVSWSAGRAIARPGRWATGSWQRGAFHFDRHIGCHVRPSDAVKIDPLGRVHTFCHAVRGKWHMMGVNLSAGGSLQWFRNELCKADAEKARQGGRRFTTC